MGILSRLFGIKPSAPLASDPPARPPVWSAAPPRSPTGRFGKDRYQPEGQWVQTTIMLKVAGVQHRKDNAGEFARAVHVAEASGARYGLSLSPEPGNPHDPNAIKVFGVVGSKSWHIGYLDRDTAAEVTQDLISKGVPIAAELYEVWVGEEGYVDFKMLVLAPSGYGHKARLRARQAS